MLSVTQKSCTQIGTIVEKLQGLVPFTKPSRTLQRLSEYVELPPVKSRSWREPEGWSYSPPNGAAFKLNLAGPLLGHGNTPISHRADEKP